jgi:hypothetical protein
MHFLSSYYKFYQTITNYYKKRTTEEDKVKTERLYHVLLQRIERNKVILFAFIGLNDLKKT